MASEKSYGPIIGLIIIVAIIALGSIYFLNERNQENGYLQDEQQQNEVAEIKDQGESDEIGAIEADLEATDFNNLDTELSEIESELNAEASVQ